MESKNVPKWRNLELKRIRAVNDQKYNDESRMEIICLKTRKLRKNYMYSNNSSTWGKGQKSAKAFKSQMKQKFSERQELTEDPTKVKTLNRKQYKQGKRRKIENDW